MKPSSPQKSDEPKNAALPPEFLRRIREIEIRARRVVNNVFSGEYHSAFKGRGMEYAESRPYQPGDDIRVMDWNVTARANAPFVKMFREERELTLMLMVDMSASERFGSVERFKSEVATELCAALAFSAIKNNDKVGLIAFTDRIELFIPPKKGRSSVLRLIRDILFFKPEGRGTDIGATLDYLNMVVKKRAIVFLVSDFRAGGYASSLKATARKHDLIAVPVIDPRETSLPDAGIVRMRDAETGEVVTVDTSDPLLRREYEESLRAESRERDRLFALAGVDQVVIHSDKSYMEPLVKFFKAREKRYKLG